MSKWTLIRKTQAASKCSLQNLWEGCFKMKVYHCKNQGGTRFGLQIRMVKLQDQICREQPSHGWRKLPGATLQIE